MASWALSSLAPKNNPINAGVGIFGKQLVQCTEAANLDVIRVSAEAEDIQAVVLFSIERNLEHSASLIYTLELCFCPVSLGGVSGFPHHPGGIASGM